MHRLVFLLALSVVSEVAIPAPVVADSAQGDPIADGSGDGGYEFFAYGGSLLVAHESQLSGVGNPYSLGLGFSTDLARPRYTALDLELLALSREFDTPIAGSYWGTIDNKTHIDTISFRLGARLFYPERSPLSVYASGGLGYYKTTMRVSGTLLGIPGSYEESDTSWQPYYGAGIRYHFSDWSLGFDYRHTELKGDFPDFGITDADIGGDSYMLGVGWQIK